MQCFEHPDSAAIGVCRGCGKGVCRVPCARDTGAGLACSDVCGQRVMLYESLNRKAGASYGSATRHVWIGPAFFIVTGALFAFFGLREREVANFATALGGVFVVFGIVLLIRHLSWAKALR